MFEIRMKETLDALERERELSARHAILNRIVVARLVGELCHPMTSCTCRYVQLLNFTVP